MSELNVRRVRGRYPRRAILRSENIEAQVQEVGRIYKIRLDDAANPEAWIEILVEITEDLPCLKNGSALRPPA
jgi:hypothetical protein